MLKNNFIKTTTALSLIVLLSGCGLSQKERFEAFSNSYQKADYCAATDALLDKKNVCNKEAEDIDAKDYDLDAQLNSGTTLFLAKKPDLSNTLFENAAQDIQEGLSSNGVGRAAVEVVANASLMDYDPMVMDSVYLQAYTTLNALSLKDKENAKIQIERAQNVQTQAAQAFSEEITDAQKKSVTDDVILSKEQQAATDKNIQDVMKNYKDLNKFKGYADFVNPYMTYLSGLYYLLNSNTAADKEFASHYLKKVAGMVNKNSFVKEDLRLAEKLANNKITTVEPTTWVIFENGMVTHLEEFRLDLPIFLATDKVKTASIALPKPKEREEAYPNISVSNGTNKVKTELLTNVDNIFMAEFNKKLPTMITKAITKLTLQTIAQAAAQNKFGDLSGIAAAGYSVLTAGADTRSWYSLPKNIQLAKIKKTGSDTVTLYIGSQELNVNIPKEGHSLIYVRVPYKGMVPAINVIDL